MQAYFILKLFHVNKWHPHSPPILSGLLETADEFFSLKVTKAKVADCTMPLLFNIQRAHSLPMLPALASSWQN